MKSVFSAFPSLALIVLTTSLFAASANAADQTVYRCEPLKNSEGQTLPGNPAFAIEFGQNVTLEEIRFDLHASRILGEMTKTSQEVEFATYQLGDISVNVGKFFDQFWRDGANITVPFNGASYSASCM